VRAIPGVGGRGVRGVWASAAGLPLAHSRLRYETSSPTIRSNERSASSSRSSRPSPQPRSSTELAPCALSVATTAAMRWSCRLGARPDPDLGPKTTDGPPTELPSPSQGRGVGGEGSALVSAGARTSAASPYQADRVDLEQQRRRAALARRFRVEDACLAESKPERLGAARVLVEQVAEVGCWWRRRGDRQEHAQLAFAAGTTTPSPGLS